MSRLPCFLERMRSGYRLGNSEVVDGMYRDGFMCPMADQLMGRTAETLAEQYEIGREEQDQFALASQRKAGLALGDGVFNDEIVPVETKKGVVDTDEHVRPDTTLQKLG